MKVLIGCEESQRVCKAFRDLGHEAYSNDVIYPSGGKPEWHIKCDIREILWDGWDMLIAFPPCTYLTNTANRVFVNNPDRWQKRVDALILVKTLMDAPIYHIAIENPVGAISTHIRKPDQIIQPFHHGHKDSKKTCLWLKNLPLLEPTEIVEPEYIISKSGKRHSKTHWKNPGNGKLRSKTYPGIANAMASQWGNLKTLTNEALAS